MEQVQEQIQSVKAEIESVAAEIHSVEAKIEFVEGEIDGVTKQLAVINLSDEDKLYYRQEEDFLRQEKNHLRQEKNRLRQKKDRLRQEKDRLRQKEDSLRLEKPTYFERSQALGSISEHGHFEIPKTDTKTIEMIRDIHLSIVRRGRATPQKTPASHGNTEYVRLEQEGKVTTFNGIEGEPSILSLGEMRGLSELTTEHQIVAMMTPRLESIFREHQGSNTVVVNSEEYKWLETSNDKVYNQKPDLFVCHKALYKERDPFNSSDAALLKIRRESDIFGVLANWKLRRFLAVVCEAKKKIDNAALGETINYGSHLCFEDDGPVTVRLVLFDVSEFWLVEVVKGTAASIQKCKWSTAGSLSLFHKFALRNPLIEALDEACRHFGLTVDKDSFLGQGAFGVVFQVKNQHGRLLAMKIVADEGSNVKELKTQKQFAELAKSKCPECVVGVEENGFLHIPKKAGILLLSEVGGHYSTLSAKKIADSLVALHRENILHGDCRVENIVNVNGEAQWIDFRSSSHFTSMDVSTEKAFEKKMLQESLTRAFSFFD